MKLMKKVRRKKKKKKKKSRIELEGVKKEFFFSFWA
jgi:hypothetical protein